MRFDTICMLGGCGFIGRHLITRLTTVCRRVVVLTSRRERNRDLLVLPTVELLEADIHDPQVLRQHFRDAAIVINLVGILNEGRQHEQSFRGTHIELTRKMVDACIKTGVSRFLHLSALNANASTGTSIYLRSKGEAENYLFSFATQHMQVSSFRPSVVFGPHDKFFNRFAALLTTMPVFPLACPHARFAPIYVGDLVDVICADLHDTTPGNRKYNLCGPQQYTLRELLEYIAATLGLKRQIINLPDFVARLQAHIMGLMPGKPFSYDNYLSLQKDSVCEQDCATQQTTIESVVPDYLVHTARQEYLQSLRMRARRNIA